MTVQPVPLRSNSRLEQFVGDEINFAFSICERPKRQIQVLATDPKEGMYWISEERAEYLKDISMSPTAEVDDANPFGKVQFIAYNASKTMFAMYCDPDSSGNVIVIPSTMNRELNRQQTYQVGAT